MAFNKTYNKPRPREDGPLIAQFSPQAGDLVDISGTIEFCRTVNTSSGWGFGKLWATEQRCIVPFTGLVSQVYETASVIVRGRWKEHAEYGWQLEAGAIIVDLPQDALGVRMWLEEHFPDVGPVRATAIVRAFPGEKLWEVLDNDPSKLAEVEGIGPVITAQIEATYQYVKAEREVYIGLVDYGLKATQVRDAVRQWGKTTLKVLQDDPYRLVEIGMPFKQVDALGTRNGIKRDDPRRIAAGHYYAMQRIEQDGHTCTGLKALQSMVASVDVLSIRLQSVIEQWPVVRERGALVEADGVVSFRHRRVQEQTIANFVLKCCTLEPEVAT